MFFKIPNSKIFCIGFNKTGTTTIEKTLKEFNFKLGNQIKGELLIFDWYKRDFKKIIKLCKTANAFQDVPFSLPFTYIILDQYFKNAKFILSIRNNEDQWYNSLTKFHSKLFSDGSAIPTCKQLKEAEYRYKGFVYQTFKLIYNTKDDDIYNKETLINLYNNHNYLVKEYFKSRPEKLIVINVSKKNDYFRLCEFLNIKPLRDDFPWKNKT